MIGLQTLAEFYADRLPLLLPTGLRGGADFSAWRLEDFLSDMALVGIYSRKDFYKITLTAGPATYICADQRLVLAPGEQALVCTNTQVPYTWEVPADGACRGYCCVFTEGFLPAHTHLRPADWAVFAPDKPAFFRLTAAQATVFGGLFEKMLAEQASDYPYKYELLYHYLMECIHGALKLEPAAEPHGATAATRLAAAFGTLLASQYPIVTPARQLALRTPQAFADALAVHVNYLNRALKDATGKTTTQLLAERLVQEARTLLLHTDWPIGHISYCLGFEEPTHFTRLFRKYAHCSPSSLRQV
jgi:AraC family transcriptional activator of pobA